MAARLQGELKATAGGTFNAGQHSRRRSRLQTQSAANLGAKLRSGFNGRGAETIMELADLRRQRDALIKLVEELEGDLHMEKERKRKRRCEIFTFTKYSHTLIS